MEARAELAAHMEESAKIISRLQEEIQSTSIQIIDARKATEQVKAESAASLEENKKTVSKLEKRISVINA